MRHAKVIAKKMVAERLPKRVAPAQQIQQVHERTFTPPRRARTLSHGSITISRREIRKYAATAIEKSWRGYSTRQKCWHALGSVILIQAFSCGWIAQPHLNVLRTAALQIGKDRDYAARVVQRFFSMVKEEVDRLFREEKKRCKAKRKAKKRRDELEESLLENVWKSTIGERPVKIDRFRSKGVPPVGNRNFRAPTNAPRPDDDRARTMMNNSNKSSHHQRILVPGHIQLRQQQQQQKQQ
jgi:hypothetical protein